MEAHRDFRKFSGTSIEEFTGWMRRILFNNLATAIEKHVLADKRDVRKQRSLDHEIGDGDHSKARLARYGKPMLACVQQMPRPLCSTKTSHTWLTCKTTWPS